MSIYDDQSECSLDTLSEYVFYSHYRPLSYSHCFSYHSSGVGSTDSTANRSFDEDYLTCYQWSVLRGTFLHFAYSHIISTSTT